MMFCKKNTEKQIVYQPIFTKMAEKQNISESKTTQTFTFGKGEYLKVLQP